MSRCESHTSPDSARSAAWCSFWLSTMAPHRAAAALPAHWKPSSHSGVDDELMADTRPVDTDRNRSDAACDGLLGSQRGAVLHSCRSFCGGNPAAM